mmetsp:Transcript_22844/g.70879  ORF Transcript_22844/g.70879 Transcript_22844/m.70879 type:complete len:245 (-) Transcript_22844:735-1469(-)
MEVCLRREVGDGRNARERGAAEELERGAAAGAHVRHLGGDAHLLDGGDGVAAADDAGAAGAGELGELGGDGERALGEGIKFEDAEGAVPDDGLGGGERVGNGRDGGRPRVEAHPALADAAAVGEGDDLVLRIRLEFRGGDDVRGHDQRHAELLGLGDDARGGGDQIVLHERGAHVLALGLEEREGEAAAEHQDVHLLHERRDHGELAAHLGAADDGRERPLRLVEAQEGELLLHELARGAAIGA